MTRFADRAVAAAVDALLRDAVQTGKLLPPRGAPVLAPASPSSPWARVAPASSTIRATSTSWSSTTRPRRDSAPVTVPPTFYVRLTKGLVKLLGERTGDGYVLRVDLRLRPDPASTGVAVSLPSAFAYYEALGQNWERAAYIKARPVAGDLALGAEFLADLAPFIWRRYFDYAAVADIHAMKRQIHAFKGHASVAVAGHDVKVGRGGIREIEFFVQTQQLIFGGRRPKLRGARTLDMLAGLAEDGWIDAAAAEDLARAYRFLRHVEHRLQMVDDEQTQRLPTDERGLDQLALFAGFPDRVAFETATGHGIEDRRGALRSSLRTCAWARRRRSAASSSQETRWMPRLSRHWDGWDSDGPGRRSRPSGAGISADGQPPAAPAPARS